MKKPAVAIATGDPGGIGDRGALEEHARTCGLSLHQVEILERKQLKRGELKIGEISAAHGRTARPRSTPRAFLLRA